MSNPKVPRNRWDSRSKFVRNVHDFSPLYPNDVSPNKYLETGSNDDLVNSPRRQRNRSTSAPRRIRTTHASRLRAAAIRKSIENDRRQAEENSSKLVPKVNRLAYDPSKTNLRRSESFSSFSNKKDTPLPPKPPLAPQEIIIHRFPSRHNNNNNINSNSNIKQNNNIGSLSRVNHFHTNSFKSKATMERARSPIKSLNTVDVIGDSNRLYYIDRPSNSNSNSNMYYNMTGDDKSAKEVGSCKDSFTTERSRSIEKCSRLPPRLHSSSSSREEGFLSTVKRMLFKKKEEKDGEANNNNNNNNTRESSFTSLYSDNQSLIPDDDPLLSKISSSPASQSFQSPRREIQAIRQSSLSYSSAQSESYSNNNNYSGVKRFSEDKYVPSEPTTPKHETIRRYASPANASVYLRSSLGIFDGLSSESRYPSLILTQPSSQLLSDMQAVPSPDVPKLTDSTRTLLGSSNPTRVMSRNSTYDISDSKLTPIRNRSGTRISTDNSPLIKRNSYREWLNSEEAQELSDQDYTYHP